MLRMFLDPDGGIRWANPLAASLSQNLSGGPSTLTGLMHPGERSAVAALLYEARQHGQAAGRVRLNDSASPNQPRYLQLVIARAGSWHTEVNLPPGLVLQGWDVSALMARIHRFQVAARREVDAVRRRSDATAPHPRNGHDRVAAGCISRPGVTGGGDRGYQF
jgi:hypothetical protein